MRASRLRWRKANPEKVRELNRRYRNANKEKERERHNRWHKAHPEKKREERRRWYKAHPEKKREERRRWYKAHLEQVVFDVVQRVAKRRVERMELTKRDTLLQEALARTPQERAERLKDLLLQTAKSVVLCAVEIEAMRQAGDDLAGMPKWFLALMQRIYHGQALAETFLLFSGNARQRVAALPMPEQERLVKDDTVTVVVRNNGHTDKLRVRVSVMQAEQLRQVFAPGGVMRDEAAQVAWLMEQDRVVEQKARLRPPVKINHRRNGLEVGPYFIPRTQLEELLSQLEAVRA